MKILVIGPSWVGDMMMSHSLYRTLKVLYPNSTIDVMASSWCSPLLKRMSEVDKAIQIPFDHKVLAIKKRRHLGRNLLKNHYNRAYILPNSFKSALIPFFANIPHRIGWLGEMRYGLLNDIRILNKSLWTLMVERYVALAYDKKKIRSSQEIPKPILLPYLQVNDSEKFQIYKTFNLSNTKPIIGFCPGSALGLMKCWPYYHYAKLAQQLVYEGFQIILLGSVTDRMSGCKIFDTLNLKQQIWCQNLIGKTSLEQATILIAICKAIITNDSGLMHIAAALDKPLLALYGPSSPNFTPPLSDKALTIHLDTNYYRVDKKNIAYNYHPSLINIKPHYVLAKLSNLLYTNK